MVTGLLFSAACLLVLFANYRLGASLLGNMANRDFISLWTGGKSVVLGLDPYDPEVWPVLRTRFGSTWSAETICLYPLWTLLLFSPLSLIPFQSAVSVWMTVSELSLIISIFLLLGAMPCRRERWLALPALVGGLAFRPFVASLTSGQIAPLLLLLLASGVALYAHGRSLQAGLLFAFLLLKPNLVILFLPAVGLLLLAGRDWRGLLGLGLGGGGLFTLSWLLQPGWLLRWLRVSGKTSVTLGTPTLWGLAFDLVGSERWILAGTLAVVLVSATVLFLVSRECEEQLLGMGLAVCGSLLITPYLWNYDQLLLLVPALVAFCHAKVHCLPRIAAWFAVLFVIPWGLFWIAHIRGFDSLSVLVTVAVMGYLCMAWWSGGRFSHSSAATSAREENGM